MIALIAIMTTNALEKDDDDRFLLKFTATSSIDRKTQADCSILTPCRQTTSRWLIRCNVIAGDRDRDRARDNSEALPRACGRQVG